MGRKSKKRRDICICMADSLCSTAETSITVKQLDSNKILNINNHPPTFPGGSDGKVSAYNAGDPGSIPELGRSPGEGNGNPLQYSCMENPMDRGAW